MNIGNRNLVLFVAIAAVAASYAASSAALAQEPTPVVRAETSVAVVGRDASLAVSGVAPAACAGDELHLRLFVRDLLDPSQISPFADSAASVGVAAAQDDSFSGAIPLPSELPGPTRVWPGIEAACLAAPLVDQSLGVELAVRDPARNPGNSSSILLLGRSLASTGNSPDHETLGAFVGSVTALANGEKCATAVTDPAKGGSGDIYLTLGTAGQPSSCPTAGARLTFMNARGDHLYVKMTLVPQATRLLENFASEPPTSGPSGQPSAPGAPSVGSDVKVAERSQWPFAPIGIGLVAAAFLVVAVASLRLRRR